MTPTEQDKELREKLNSLFESVFSQGVRAGWAEIRKKQLEAEL